MDFLNGAKEYARNPLGIVALFISLIYGFASLLLGASADKLESAERWPLLIFIVSFPFAVLLVFYKLVTEHHGKLYSPGDYKTDDSFLKTLSAEEQEQKLENEAKEATGNVFFSPSNEDKDQAVNLAKDRIKKSEDYVIQLLSKELGIQPDIGVKISSDHYTFDAAYITPGVGATILEVKYYSEPRITFNAVKEFIYRVKLASEYMNIDTEFVLALVFDGEVDSFDFVIEAWRKSLEESDIEIELRVFSGAEIDV